MDFHANLIDMEPLKYQQKLLSQIHPAGIGFTVNIKLQQEISACRRIVIHI
jgi:hypothetical protein